MNERKPISFDDSEDNLDIEVVDLDTVDGIEDAGSPKVTDHFLQWQRSLSKKHIRVGSTIGIVFLVLLVLLFNMQNKSALLATLQAKLTLPIPRIAEKLPLVAKISPSLVIFTQKDGFVCVDKEVWSPDNNRVAVSGYAKGCNFSDSSEYDPTLIALYDSHSGKLLTKIQAGDAILQALHSQFPTITGTPAIYHGNLLWSPRDAHRIALLFAIQFFAQQPNAFSIPLIQGLLLIDDTGKHLQVHLFVPVALSPQSSPIYTVWDVERGKVIDSRMYDYNSNPWTISLPAAATYSWGANGTLTAQKPYGKGIPTKPVIGPVGNSNGDTSFTLWQSGFVGLVSRSNTNLTYKPGVYVFGTVSSAWSPDGRYLVDNIILAGRFLLPGQRVPDSKTLSALNVENLPVIPLRDAALQTVVQSLSSNGNGYMDQISVNWSPNGRFLASARNEALNGSSDLYQCDTGYKIATLLSPSSVQGPIGHNNIYSTNLDWSSDGSRVLAQDSIASAVLIWQLHLPK